MVSCSESHFGGDAQDAARGELFPQGGQILRRTLLRNDQCVPYFERRAFFPLLGRYPVLRLDFPDSSSKIFFQGQGVFFIIAVNGDSNRFPPFDFCNNGVRISGDAFAPGVFPFGGGKFVPTPCHAESMGFFRQGGKNGLIVTAFPLFLGLWGSIVENLIYSKKNIKHQLSNHFIFSMVANLESGVKIIFLYSMANL